MLNEFLDQLFGIKAQKKYKREARKRKRRKQHNYSLRTKEDYKTIKKISDAYGGMGADGSRED